MSRKGNCLDNSLAENFFGLLIVPLWINYVNPKDRIKIDGLI